MNFLVLMTSTLVCAVVGLSVILWVFVRSRSRSLTTPSADEEPEMELAAEEPEQEEGAPPSRHAHNRHRRYSKRYPTLAQTGGLPPIKQPVEPLNAK